MIDPLGIYDSLAGMSCLWQGILNNYENLIFFSHFYHIFFKKSCNNVLDNVTMEMTQNRRERI